jgi:hypothetical protein
MRRREGEIGNVSLVDGSKSYEPLACRSRGLESITDVTLFSADR